MMLSPRDLQIVSLLKQGLPDKLIAYYDGITIKAVQHRLHNLYRKTGARNRVQLALMFSKKGI